MRQATDGRISGRALIGRRGSVQREGRKAARTGLYIAALLATSSWAAPVLAQSASQQAPAVNATVDANGVDLSSGTFATVLAAVEIGDPATTGMRFARYSVTGGWRDAFIGDIRSNGSTYTVSVGNRAERFTYNGSTFAPEEASGSTLVNAGGTLTYTVADGTAYVFSTTVAPGHTTGRSYGGVYAALVSATRPNGVVWTYTHRTQNIRVGWTTNNKPQFLRVSRLQSVTTNTGYQAQFAYARDTLSTSTDYDGDDGPVDEWYTVAKVTLFNRNVDSCGVDANSCSFSRAWPSVTPTLTATGESFTDNSGRTTEYRYTGAEVSGRRSPGFASDDMTATVSGGRIVQVVDRGVTTGYGYSGAPGSAQTVVRTQAGKTETYQFDAAGNLLSLTNGAGAKTEYEYTAGAVTKVTQPEGNYTVLTRDGRGNVLATTSYQKNGASGTIGSSASYDTVCGTPRKCNAPNTTTDARGGVTNYDYDPGTGELVAVRAPAPAAGAVRPETRYGYTSYGGVRLLTQVSACRTGAACVGGADETRTSIDYGSVAASNLRPVSVTVAAGDGSVSATTSASYDAVGDVVAVDGPLAGAGDTVRMAWAPDRQLEWSMAPDPDGGGPRKAVAMHRTYDAAGRLSSVETGTVPSGAVDWSGFAGGEAVQLGYDGNGRLASEARVWGGATRSLTQRSWDALGRPLCTAVRLAGANPDACAVGVGADGPDRVTRVTEYDGADRALEVTAAWGTADAAAERVAFTPNGRVASVTDGKGNVTAFGYDGWDRPVRTTWPGGSYEEVGLDAGGNVVSRRLRDGQVLGYGYDALGRLTARDVPGGSPYEYGVVYAYDLQGRLTRATDANTHFTAFGYDALGRRVSEESNWSTRTSGYDAAGRRTRLTWGDGFYVSYEYDAAGLMSVVRENGGLALVSYGYDDLGRRTSVTRGNGTVTTYAHDAGSRLTGLTHDLAGSGQDLTLGFAYNSAGQIATRTASNDAYTFTGHVAVDRPYQVNGLNQYTSAGAVGFGYDGRGNLTQSGAASYGYTSENRLATAPGGYVMTWDPLGRYHWIDESAYLATRSVTWMQYDGAALIEERTNAGVARRYVHGAGVDEPVVWYEGAGTGARRYLHADERGSIVAVSDDAGNATAINRYDEYGIPASGNVGRFQYTGQKWIPELGMYDYKARMYSPTLGRFMQTDPIGYADGLNWYDYAGGDPVNATDPSGLSYESCMLNKAANEVLAGLGATVDIVNCVKVDNGPGGFTRFLRGIVDRFRSPRGRNDGEAEGAPQKDDLHYLIQDVALCSADALLNEFRQPGGSAPGAPYAREGTHGGVPLGLNNFITQNVDVKSTTITNVTEEGHFFYRGSVVIAIKPTWYGSSVTIEGRGTNRSFINGALNREAAIIFRALAAKATLGCTFKAME